MAETAVAFDAKDFDRSKVEDTVDPLDPQKRVRHFKGFFSPLGAGVVFKHGDLFKASYSEANEKLSAEFKMGVNMPFFSSNILKRELGLSRAIAYCNKLVSEVEDFIELVHVTFVVLPPSKCPVVSVGGRRCPEIRVKTEEFVRSLGPMFSYLSAWNFLRKRQEDTYDVMLDGFRSKPTIAWDELSGRTKPRVYSHGDECNAFVSVADIIAFLTDVRLYQSSPGPPNDPMQYRGLRPENVKRVWESNSFATDCWYLDESVLSKFKWYSDELVDTSSLLARPVVFLIADEIEKLAIGAESQVQGQSTLPVAIPEEKKFHRVLRRLEPYYAAVKLAERRGGCVQFFDRYLDSDKVRNGDVIVYMGDNAKRIAKTLEDGYDIEVVRARDLRKEMETKT